MKKYILIANEARDTDFLYADFATEDNMLMLLFDYSKKRIGLIKVLDKVRLKNTRIVYYTLFRHFFKETIDSKLTDSNSQELVFIVMARAYEKYGHYLIIHLRETYPYSKIVLYLTDLIHNMRFSVDESRKLFDIICSFDKKEAADNNMFYLMEPFSSKLIPNIPRVDEPLFDVSFVGAAKGRYDKIMWLYNELIKIGLTCDFYIVGVEKKKQIKSEGIHYDEFLNFDDLLKHVTNSRCVVEIMQKGGFSATTRFAEAMLFRKNLITDCPALENSDEKSIIYFDESTDFNPDIIRSESSCDFGKYADELSIKNFINTIDKHLTYKTSK